MSKLNYSKWDNLELSDDSDVEVHPNVDKKSFIRWKQRDIHEKREVRKQELLAYKTELKTNQVLEPMLEPIVGSTKSEGHSFYSREVSRLSADRASRGNKDGPEGPTPNDMILSLLLQINQEDSVKGKEGSDLDAALTSRLEDHLGRLRARSAQLEGDISKIEAEDKKKITSEGLREGFNSGHVSKAEIEEFEASERKQKKEKSKTPSSSTTIETLNSPGPSSSSSSQSTQVQQSADSDAEDSDDEDVPDLTPMMKAFGLLPPCIPSFIPLSATALPATFTVKHLDGKPFQAALEFLSSHKQLLRQSTDHQSTPTDAMLVEAFQSEMRGEQKRARGFVEKALMLQYLGKLGKDSVNLFFKRMASQDGKAVFVFFNDVLSTYVRIATRCKDLQSQESQSSSGAGGQEQIQLVAEDPSTIISFEIPDGPAPENLVLEGENTENLDVEKVKEFLNTRWEIFNTQLPSDLQTALKTKSLEKVNKVLGEMQVDQAEHVVGLLDQAGILNFSSAEIRDETGQPQS
ncbi:unnamed protein product [Sympodiomycopsis kandeliae]